MVRVAGGAETWNRVCQIFPPSHVYPAADGVGGGFGGVGVARGWCGRILRSGPLLTHRRLRTSRAPAAAIYRSHRATARPQRRAARCGRSLWTRQRTLPRSWLGAPLLPGVRTGPRQPGRLRWCSRCRDGTGSGRGRRVRVQRALCVQWIVFESVRWSRTVQAARIDSPDLYGPRPRPTTPRRHLAYTPPRGRSWR